MAQKLLLIFGKTKSSSFFDPQNNFQPWPEHPPVAFGQVGQKLAGDQRMAVGQIAAGHGLHLASRPGFGDPYVGREHTIWKTYVTFFMPVQDLGWQIMRSAIISPGLNWVDKNRRKAKIIPSRSPKLLWTLTLKTETNNVVCPTQSNPPPTTRKFVIQNEVCASFFLAGAPFFICDKWSSISCWDTVWRTYVMYLRI